MELLILTMGMLTMLNFLDPKQKEGFEPTYFDSEEYYRQNVSSKEKKAVNTFSPSEQPKTKILSGYNNQYAQNINSWTPNEMGSPIANNQMLKESQDKFIQTNSLYNKETINGVSLKDYYDTYTKNVLAKGTWFLNKDMPEDTKQYKDESGVQQRMEEVTGLRQKRDREMLGIPNRAEAKNLFTPEEKTVGYGYQYGQGGPGLAITRQKEFEDLKQTIKYKTNEQPFEKLHIGPGLSIGTEIPAAGGFQQYTRVVPDNISEYSSNQLPGMVAGGKWGYSDAPTSQQPVVSNRPQKFYSLCQYGPAAGKSIMTAPMTIPDYAVSLKNQNRTFINYGFGAPLQKLDNFLK